MGDLASGKIKKQEDSLPKEGGPFDQMSSWGFYKAGIRDLALEGERLRGELKLKMALLFKAFRLYLRTFGEFYNYIYIYQLDKSGPLLSKHHNPSTIFL